MFIGLNPASAWDAGHKPAMTSGANVQHRTREVSLQETFSETLCPSIAAFEEASGDYLSLNLGGTFEDV
jgi:hypothetical protein